MKLKPIENKKEYSTVLNWVDEQFDKKLSPKSDAGQKLQIALILLKNYEDKKYPVPSPDPIEAIKIKMEEKGLRNQDFVGKIGSKGYVSAILSKRKPLTMQIAKLFFRELGVPAEVLLS